VFLLRFVPARVPGREMTGFEAHFFHDGLIQSPIDFLAQGLF